MLHFAAARIFAGKLLAENDASGLAIHKKMAKRKEKITQMMQTAQYSHQDASHVCHAGSFHREMHLHSALSLHPSLQNAWN